MNELIENYKTGVPVNINFGLKSAAMLAGSVILAGVVIILFNKLTK